MKVLYISIPFAVETKTVEEQVRRRLIESGIEEVQAITMMKAEGFLEILVIGR